MGTSLQAAFMGNIQAAFSLSHSGIMANSPAPRQTTNSLCLAQLKAKSTFAAGNHRRKLPA